MVDDERPSGPSRGRGSWTGLHRSGSTRSARPSRADRVAALWQNSELDGTPVGEDTDGLPEPVAASDDAGLTADSADPESTDDSDVPDDSASSGASDDVAPSTPRVRNRIPVAERATPSPAVAPAARTADPDDHAWLDDEAGPVVRPYTLTGGRSRPVTSGLGLLTHVESLFAPEADLVNLQPEHRSILSLTRTALSVAELSARLDLPVGVVRILIGDLLQANLISTFEADAAMRAPDDDILQAVIVGLRAL